MKSKFYVLLFKKPLKIQILHSQSPQKLLTFSLISCVYR